MKGKTWAITYGSVSRVCKTENDAKLLTRELLKKGHQVTAQTLDDVTPSRTILIHELEAWLQE